MKYRGKNEKKTEKRGVGGGRAGGGGWGFYKYGKAFYAPVLDKFKSYTPRHLIKIKLRHHLFCKVMDELQSPLHKSIIFGNFTPPRPKIWVLIAKNGQLEF